MTAIDDFVPYVVPYAGGASHPVAKRAVVEAIDEFCRKTWYYRERLAAQRILDTDTVVGDFDAYPNPITVNGAERYPIVQTKSEQYVIEAPTGMRPLVVVEVDAGGTMLKPITSFTAADTSAWYDKDGASSYFTRNPSRVTEIFPTPETPDDIVVDVAFIPLHNASSVPDLLFTNFRQVICDGALSKLYAQSNQSYSDPKGAVYKNLAFTRGIAEARIEGNRGNTRAMVQARSRGWA